ncbi:MAG TPA: hypothetical protein VMY35_12105 [Phycisphaerae bacterium]|nr:hypothetical protein [Phycisphaerae bacterium]
MSNCVTFEYSVVKDSGCVAATVTMQQDVFDAIDDRPDSPLRGQMVSLFGYQDAYGELVVVRPMAKRLWQSSRRGGTVHTFRLGRFLEDVRARAWVKGVVYTKGQGYASVEFAVIRKPRIVIGRTRRTKR